MTEPAPTLAEQIDAVEWAELWLSRAVSRRNGLSHEQIRQFRRRLEAAVETLRTLEFTREVAR
jgi:hypothetical protein